MPWQWRDRTQPRGALQWEAVTCLSLAFVKMSVMVLCSLIREREREEKNSVFPVDGLALRPGKSLLYCTKS